MALREACGVVAVRAPGGEAAEAAAEALFALQHRGQEAAGLAALTPAAEAGWELRSARGPGLVQEVFPEGVPQALKGAVAAIGHVRYSTSGGSAPENAQPLVMESRFGRVAIAHNGQLVDAPRHRERLMREGALFRTTSDTEVVVHLMARSRAEGPGEALRLAMGRVQGGFALVLLVGDRLLAARDPAGIRPLVLGEREGEPVLASESAALGVVGAHYLREVLPGEVVSLPAYGPLPSGWERPQAPASRRRPAFCAFEYVYFSRPDSAYATGYVGDARERLGEALAEEWPTPGAEAVVGVPDSGLPAAVGYARRLGVPLRLGLAKNRYVGRTFIRPGVASRREAAERKLGVVGSAVAGRRVVLVDDSLVRGTTARRLVGLLREAGAREVHLRIAAPPYRHPCPYGIDVPSRTELPLAGGTPEAWGQALGADSLAFLSVAGLHRALGRNLCTACFSGRYPVGANRLREGGAP